MGMVTESRPAKQAFVEQLVADGLTTVVGNPGTVEQGLLDVLEQTPGMRYVLTLQEAAAVGIADGIARGSNGAAVLQLHSGVGLGNSIGMLYQSMRGHSPLVCFAGEAGLAYANLDAQMAVDLVAMARPVTKWAERVTHPDSVVRMLRRAVKVALTPPRGPVFLALPADVLDATTDVPVLPTVIPDSRSAPHPDVVAAAAERLGRATTPVVLVGDGVDLASAHHHLVAVAEVLGADVWSVDSSVPNIPASHPLSRGQLGHMFGTVSEASIGGADAVLVVGTYVFPEVFPSLRSPFAPDASIVHIDLDAWEIAKNHPVDVAMLADPANALRDLSRHLGETMSQEARRAAGGRLARARDRAAARGDGPHADSLLARFCRSLAARAGDDLVVFDEALTASPVVTHHLPGDRPGSYHLTRGGSLGVGIPGAVGLKIAHPDRTVVAFTGDGGSMYTPQALWTAARDGVGVAAVVCNNHRYELLDRNIGEYWREHGVAPHAHPGGFSLREPAIDFAGLAASLGGRGLTVRRPDDIPAAADAALSPGRGPVVIDLDTDDLG